MKQFLFVLIAGLLSDVIAFPTYLNATGDDCPRNNSLIASFPNPTNCSRYYQCENGTKTEMTCPLQQQYNPLLRVCDDPKYAGCKENGSSHSAHRPMPPLVHSQNNENATQSSYNSKPYTEPTQIVAGNDNSSGLQNADVLNSTSSPSNENSTVNTSLLVTSSSGLPSKANTEASTIKSISKGLTNVASSRVSNDTLSVRNNSSTGEVKQEQFVGNSTLATAVDKSSKEVLVTNGENPEVNDEDTTISSEDYDDSSEKNDHEQNGSKKPK